jgi:ribA/ribD-fused uncharacterized protein
MIREFKGEYRWLSNFAPCKIRFDGRLFASVEHAYMSAKSNDIAWKEFCADSNNTAGKVKKKSKEIVLREDWQSVKVEVMRQLLEMKFSQRPYRKLLLNTGDLFIQEGNWWGDSFWGVDFKTNTGENNLGILIMAIREELVREELGKSRLRKMAERLMGFFEDVLRWG